MTHGFTDALNVVLKEEAGFSDDPKDPGGMTNLGVTARSWAQWSSRPATEQVMRGLRIVDVAPLYKAWFWDKVCGDQLPPALALVAFDFAVNEGTGTAIKLLQGICGASKDGKIGPATLRALQAYITTIGLAKLINRYCDAQRNHYRELPGFIHDGRGWLNRVADVEKEALSWL
jgi:lysozyme family protein